MTGAYVKINIQYWQMQDLLKGGSVVVLRVKNLGPCPLLAKTTPIFKHFLEKLLVLPVNPFIFDQDLC